MRTPRSAVVPDGDCRMGGLPPRFPRELRQRRTLLPPRFSPVIVGRVSRGAIRRRGRSRERPAALRTRAHGSDTTWEPAALDVLHRHAVPVGRVRDGSSAVLAALQLHRRRKAGGTPSRTDHTGGLRAPLRGSETTAVASWAATLSSKARQALSRADLFRFLGVTAEDAHATAVATTCGHVSSRRVEAAVAADKDAFAACQAADAHAATVLAAAAEAEAAAIAAAAAQESETAAAAGPAAEVDAAAEPASTGLIIYLSPLSDFD